MNYFETDSEFYGHKFFDIAPENGQSVQDFLAKQALDFIKKYVHDSKTVLVYTSDKVLQEMITKGVENPTALQFASTASEAQGAEWDYVILLDEFSFEGRTAEKVTKEYNTLVGRPKLGFISPKIKNGWVINNIKQERRPAEIGLSKEEIESFKA
jgi:hypothetical protein